MSFSFEQKKYIITQQYKSSCCRKAMLDGIILSKGFEFDGKLRISLEKKECALFAARLVSEFYGTSPDIKTATDGGRRVVLDLNSPSALRYISSASPENMFKSKCELCGQSFLRGVFLSSGRMSSPESQYSLEFSLGVRCELFLDYFSSLGLTPRISDKPHERVLYFKNGTDIEDFCGLAGMNRALFSVLDARAEGELRKNAMRVANCETNNIEKAVAAARRQIKVIKALEDANLLSRLPEELCATAKLRTEYADLTLAQLAQVFVPPISKPGLSHRLRKIIELGEQILSEHSEEER